MFENNLGRKYALTKQGVKNVKLGTIWTVIVNLVVMCGMIILYLLMNNCIATLLDGSKLPGMGVFIVLTLVFLALSILTHLQQYKYTYGVVYSEVKNTRISLAEPSC